MKKNSTLSILSKTSLILWTASLPMILHASHEANPDALEALPARGAQNTAINPLEVVDILRGVIEEARDINERTTFTRYNKKKVSLYAVRQELSAYQKEYEEIKSTQDLIKDQKAAIFQSIRIYVQELRRINHANTPEAQALRELIHDTYVSAGFYSRRHLEKTLQNNEATLLRLQPQIQERTAVLRNCQDFAMPSKIDVINIVRMRKDLNLNLDKSDIKEAVIQALDHVFCLS